MNIPFLAALGLGFGVATFYAGYRLCCWQLSRKLDRSRHYDLRNVRL